MQPVRWSWKNGWSCVCIHRVVPQYALTRALYSLQPGRAQKVLQQWSRGNSGALSHSVEQTPMRHILSTKTKEQSTRITPIVCWPETLMSVDDCRYPPTPCRYLRNVVMVSCASSSRVGRHS